MTAGAAQRIATHKPSNKATAANTTTSFLRCCTGTAASRSMGPYVGPAYGHYDHAVRYIGAGSVTAAPAWAVKVKHHATLSSSAVVRNGSAKDVHYGDSQYSASRAPARARPTRQCRNRHEHDRYRLGRNDSLDRGRFKLGFDRTFYV